MPDQDKSKQQLIEELERQVEKRTEDLTKANELLRQNNDELQTIYDEMIEGLLMTDIETKRFLRVNPSMCRMLGYAEEELLAASIEDIHPAEEVPNDLQRFQAAAEGRVSINEDRPVLRKDGSVFYADITGRRVFYDERPCLLALFRDISERKQAEQALRQSLDELRAIYDGMTDGIAIVDVETDTPIRANAALYEMLGYSEEGVKTATIRLLHPPEAMSKVDDFVRTVAEGGVKRFQGMPFLRKDGSVCHADVVTRQILYDGRPCRMSFLHDISERKRAEEALQRQYRTLKHLLHSSDHERQLIAYEIHDGLAQQLAGAIMQIQAFAHLKDKNPKEAAKALDAGLTMLQQGHFEARRLIAGVRPPILDESGVVEAVAHLIHEVGRDKGPTIDFHSGVAFDRLDPTLENAIYRIAQEALANACKHSNSERVQVSLLQRVDRLRIEIRDWGDGFDPKAVPKSHFGLEGIRQRARLLGGKCSIRSREGKGTRVTVELPVVLRDDS